jgi:hypothetical protein
MMAGNGVAAEDSWQVAPCYCQKASLALRLAVDHTCDSLHDRRLCKLDYKCADARYHKIPSLASELRLEVAAQGPPPFKPCQKQKRACCNRNREPRHPFTSHENIVDPLSLRIPRDGDQRSELMSITIPK